MGLSTTHLIIFLVIIVVIFGTKKLRNIGADLGGAVKGFKDGMKDGSVKPQDSTTAASTAASPAPQVATAAVSTPPAQDKNTIDVEAKPRA